MISENEPEELQYIENHRSFTEILFELNLSTNKRAEIDYSFLCLETVDLWLNLNKDFGNLVEKKGVAFSLILRGRRILRAAQLLLFKGFLPEAEILLRCINETVLVLSYILEDPTDKRLNKYLTFDKGKGWDFRLLSTEFLGEEHYQVYKNLSDYTHPGNFGRIKLLYKGYHQKDSIPEYDNAGMMLVTFSNLAVTLCEISNRIFPKNEMWDKKHEEIYETAIFKKVYEESIKLAQNNENFRQFFVKHSDQDPEYDEGVG
jgi:HKD family nuclease